MIRSRLSTLIVLFFSGGLLSSETFASTKKLPAKNDGVVTYLYKAPWGQEILIRELNVSFGHHRMFQLASTTDVSVVVDFSKVAFEEAFSPNVTMDSVVNVFRDKTLSDDEALLTALLSLLREKVSSAECSKEQAKRTLIRVAQIQNLRNRLPLTKPLVEILNQYSDAFSKLQSDELCKPALGGVLFILGEARDAFLRPGAYYSWFALGALNATSVHTCPGAVFVGVVEDNALKCALDIKSFPKKLAPADVLRGIQSFVMLLELRGRTPPEEKMLAEKLVGAGVYIADYPFKYPVRPENKQVRKVVLQKDGESLGVFSINDVNPGLLANVGIGNCRILLTLNGEEQYCMREAAD